MLSSWLIFLFFSNDLMSSGFCWWINPTCKVRCLVPGSIQKVIWNIFVYLTIFWRSNHYNPIVVGFASSDPASYAYILWIILRAMKKKKKSNLIHCSPVHVWISYPFSSQGSYWSWSSITLISMSGSSLMPSSKWRPWGRASGMAATALLVSASILAPPFHALHLYLNNLAIYIFHHHHSTCCDKQ